MLLCLTTVHVVCDLLKAELEHGADLESERYCQRWVADFIRVQVCFYRVRRLRGVIFVSNPGGTTTHIFHYILVRINLGVI